MASPSPLDMMVRFTWIPQDHLILLGCFSRSSKMVGFMAFMAFLANWVYHIAQMVPHIQGIFCSVKLVLVALHMMNHWTLQGHPRTLCGRQPTSQRCSALSLALLQGNKYKSKKQLLCKYCKLLFTRATLFQHAELATIKGLRLLSTDPRSCFT